MAERQNEMSSGDRKEAPLRISFAQFIESTVKKEVRNALADEERSHLDELVGNLELGVNPSVTLTPAQADYFKTKIFDACQIIAFGNPNHRHVIVDKEYSQELYKADMLELSLIQAINSCKE